MPPETATRFDPFLATTDRTSPFYERGQAIRQYRQACLEWRRKWSLDSCTIRYQG
jgi:hypothetical protein